MKNDLSDKELLQAKHRLEEAQARNRQKERKARTRRLIQEGAILENVLPEIKHMNPDEIKNLLFRRAHLLTTRKTNGGTAITAAVRSPRDYGLLKAYFVKGF